ncbi:MAG: phosphodiester glycosidase family protein [Muribaculaceae bacterium]|nr:phosphodiester glycosidase family protein [Muribaculaceae bacterium]
MKNMYFKKVFLFLACLAIFTSLGAKNQWTLKGVPYDVDTVIFKHKVGPGTTFAKYNLPGKPLMVSVLEMDLTNKYVDFETCKGGDKGVCEEQPTSMYARNDIPGHDMIAATNGDFYFYQDVVENGIPRSGQFKKNECITNPVGRAAFVLTDDRKPFIDHIDFSGTVKFGDVVTRLHTVNMQRLEWEDTGGNQLNLYTNAYGTQTEKCTGGTKIIISPKDTPFFWSANKNINAVVEQIVDGNGVTEIPAGKAVLWGRGTSEDFLKTLAVGSEITLNLKTDLREQPGVITDFKELMGGSNNIIIKDGKLVDEWPDRHPRTCIGYSKDEKTVYFIVIDGRQSISMGASLDECGDVFLALGAWHAVNLDGGGSSCMVVNGDVVNSPSDGTIRSVGNGCLLVSNAPIDDEISQADFAPLASNIITFARVPLVAYGYNQYGVLKSRDFKTVTYTCDPAIGKIDGDMFVAAGTTGSGYITMKYGDKEVKKQIFIINGELSVRLSSVVVDSHNSYSIEITGTNGNYTNAIDAASLSWVVDNPDICKVENGVVKYLSNGETMIHGSVNGFSCELKVVSMTPDYETKAVDVANNIADWKFTQSGPKNMVVTAEGEGKIFTFTGGASRSTYIKMTQAIDIPGIPQILRMEVDAGTLPLKKVTFSFKTQLANNVQYAMEFNKQLSSVATELRITVADVLAQASASGKFDIGHFPLTLSNVNFTFDALTAGSEYTMKIPSFTAVYYNLGSVDGIKVNTAQGMKIYPNPANAGTEVLIDNAVGNVNVYNSVGQLVKIVNNDSSTLSLSTQELVSGIYIVKDSQNISKLIIK